MIGKEIHQPYKKLCHHQKLKLNRQHFREGSHQIFDVYAAPEISILLVPDIVSGSRHFVPVTHNSCRSFVYDILLKFENLSVIVIGRKRIMLVTPEILPDSDR